MTCSTPAEDWATNNEETTVHRQRFLPISAFVAGNNVIAVELHQVRGEASRMCEMWVTPGYYVALVLNSRGACVLFFSPPLPPPPSPLPSAG